MALEGIDPTGEMQIACRAIMAVTHEARGVWSLQGINESQLSTKDSR